MIRRARTEASEVRRGDDLRIALGWIAPEVAEEFPGLELRWTTVPGPQRVSPRIVRTQLEDLSDAIDAPRAIALRGRSTVSAYRIFQRQLGLDPDVDFGPLETAIVGRMMEGAFLPQGLPADACTIAAVETGVPIWAYDADVLDGSLGIRIALAGETLGRGQRAVSIVDEAIAIADHKGSLSKLFAAPGPDVAPSRRGGAVALFALGIPGVPRPVVEEALWLAGSIASEPT